MKPKMEVGLLAKTLRGVEVYLEKMQKSHEVMNAELDRLGTTMGGITAGPQPLSARDLEWAKEAASRITTRRKASRHPQHVSGMVSYYETRGSLKFYVECRDELGGYIKTISFKVRASMLKKSLKRIA